MRSGEVRCGGWNPPHPPGLGFCCSAHSPGTRRGCNRLCYFLPRMGTLGLSLLLCFWWSCWCCLARAHAAGSHGRDLSIGDFDGGSVVNLAYFCTSRQKSRKTCEETAVSIYSMSLMLSPQRSKTDPRDIHVSVVANAECRSCLASKIEALQVQEVASLVVARTACFVLAVLCFCCCSCCFAGIRSCACSLFDVASPSMFLFVFTIALSCLLDAARH